MGKCNLKNDVEEWNREWSLQLQHKNTVVVVTVMQELCVYNVKKIQKHIEPYLLSHSLTHLVGRLDLKYETMMLMRAFV